MTNINGNAYGSKNGYEFNYGDAELYLETLIGSNWQDEELVVQTVDDNPARQDKSLTAVHIGTWEKLKPILTDYNQRGAGVFFTVNKTKGGRRREHFVSVRAVWCDWDKPGVPLPEWPMPPHLVVETSPGKYHIYWLVTGISAEDHGRIMDTMVKKWGCDPNATDLVRALRMPGFFHRKGEAYPAQVKRAEAEWALPPQTEDKNMEAFQVPPRKEPRRRTYGNTTTVDWDEVRSALACITPNPSKDDPYNDWLYAGMALSSTKDPKAFDIWNEWSKRSPKYKLKEIKEKWDSFCEQKGVERDDALTIDWIFNRAKQEGWEEDTRPKIQLSADLTDMTDRAEAAIMALPGPVLYQRARYLVRISPAGEPPRWIDRPRDAPLISPIPPAALRELSGKAARWLKYDKREKTTYGIVPPSLVSETLLARNEWKFPHLEGIITAPTIRSDGKLIQTPGYDSETGLYCDFDNATFPPVPERPTRDDARAALNLLYEPFKDFPFKEDCHRTATLAAVLTLIGRFTILGPVPAFVIRATTRGSGKGLLINTIATIGTGRVAPTWTQTTDEIEEEKRLFSVALAGDQCIHIDNVTRPFGNGILDSVLTTCTATKRLLGKNERQEAPWKAVIFASGNNMTFVSDTVRRIIPIDLYPECEHPEQRSDFIHNPLLPWVQKNRVKSVIAGLTVLKAFFHAGCPKDPNLPEYGSFNIWADLIRHSLLWAGLADPCGGRNNLEEESDLSYEKLSNLLHAWNTCYPDREERSLSTILKDAEFRREKEPNQVCPPNEWNALWDALAAYDSKHDGKRLDPHRIGNALRTIDGKILGPMSLVRGYDKYKKVALWRLKIHS